MRLTIELNLTSNKKTAGIKKCDICGKEEFLKKPRRWDLCSSCEKKQGIKEGKRPRPPISQKKEVYTNICQHCGEVFEIKSRYYNNQKYCGIECYTGSMYSNSRLCECKAPIKNNNKTGMCDKCRENKWHIDNINEINIKANTYQKERKSTDINFRLISNMRTAVYLKLTRKYKTNANLRTFDLIGCSIEELKQNLELKFKNGMTWDNYGIRGWHVDHIYPVSKFNLSDINEAKKAFHYTNLQPLWWRDNISKGNKILKESV